MLFLGAFSAFSYADEQAAAEMSVAVSSDAPSVETSMVTKPVAETSTSEISNSEQTKPQKPAAVSTEPVRRSAAGGFSSAALSQLVLGLGLVIGVILLLAWLVKRMGYMTGLAHSGLKVVATLPLTARERLVVVQAGEQQLLLGVSPGRINLLQSFDEPIIDGPVTPQFAVKLRQAMSKSTEAKTS